MESRGGTRVLKKGRTRSVVLERNGCEDVVVKRFHHPERLQSLRDPWRARAEFRALERLRAEGIRAPSPLGVVTGGGRCEVRMEAVKDALTLEELLEGARPVNWLRLAEKLGTMLARLHGARLDHEDLHPGNVLVDADDRPWLIDFHSLRVRRRRTSIARMRADLTHIA